MTLWSSSRSPQKETTPFYPRSPYAVAKMYAYWITVNYREAYGITLAMEFCLITKARCVVRPLLSRTSRWPHPNKWAAGLFVILVIWMLRETGHARDYVEMQWLMLQQKEPVDYVIATGRRIR